MSSTNTIRLRKLLCCVYEAQQAREEALIQRCAELALQDGGRNHNFDADDRSTLQDLSDGRVSVPVMLDERTSAILNSLRTKASNYVRERESRDLGRPSYAKTAWEVTVEQLFPAAMRVNPRLFVSDNQREWYLTDYCKRASQNRLEPDDAFPEAIERLDTDNFARACFRAIKEECPQEASAIVANLPEGTTLDEDTAERTRHASAVLDVLRRAIKATANSSGEHATSEVVLREAKVARADGLAGLRELQDKGKYNGFQRHKAARYRSG